ncbi:MAG: sulfide/dihydroorotate dehydrogenase-like FAD/NAD-binding protein [Candidatus Firestonebacteria bacterium]|nr:sulfide/dihydroorotate dehydrogenase-like FAD/NAD-binding protein [Candidatus Firestonebacteria bacterium]
MFKIIKREDVSDTVKLIEVEAPLIASSAKSGQFVVLRLKEGGERVPLTIADKDKKKGTVTIVFQVVGKSTIELASFKVGDSIKDLLGPLGKATDFAGAKNIVCVAGGVGIAEIYPEVKELHEEGKIVTTIIGARNKALLFFEEELKAVSDAMHVTTDDGSYGRKGFVSDVLKELLEKDKTIDLVVAVGPVIMMKVVSDLTKNYNVRTIVSLNPIMLDATGMCGACRVTVGGKTLFGCVDGPSFDGHQVDFGELIKRLNQFKDEEKNSAEIYKLKCRECRENGH